MSLFTAALLILTMVFTSFLSGIFGMAGGLILVGVLLALLPLPDAMALHAVTQISSNGWRAASWIRYVRWRVIGGYALGCFAALIGWSLFRYVPDKPVALLLLGVSPFMVKLLPRDFRPNAENPVHGLIYGGLCMTLMLLTGVAGPLLDRFFLGGSLERRQIVATKAVCQVFGHLLKLVYFGGLIEQAGNLDPVMAVAAVLASMAGTFLARPVLEAMSDTSYRLWAGRIILAVSLFFIAQGCWLLLQERLA
ncbi:sulfite exporter TauE/SafE family protein [Rhodovarius crocodyli]|uniref:Probable membrane transporter protein n=1 Tax=Rhodovarius crocodyli TaxID=1979269 RepID=A0A437MGY1_9PROT|nr:sulfite exporter TauE/SafE family protein [Rhodovarius crocodyli]RVT96897.1 sulfite exporter TauE/SafE family protein [Rhodovarius crocodyli]